MKECLSKVGMHLEKRLGYFHTKNKDMKDETVLLVISDNSREQLT